MDLKISFYPINRIHLLKVRQMKNKLIVLCAKVAPHGTTFQNAIVG